MPIYEYVCPICKKEKEIIQHFDDPPPECEKCHKNMEKIMSLSSFALKGTGWYITDYGRKKKASGINKLPKDKRTKKSGRTAQDKCKKA